MDADWGAGSFRCCLTCGRLFEEWRQKRHLFLRCHVFPATPAPGQLGLSALSAVAYELCPQSAGPAYRNADRLCRLLQAQVEFQWQQHGLRLSEFIHGFGFRHTRLGLRQDFPTATPLAVLAMPHLPRSRGYYYIFDLEFELHHLRGLYLLTPSRPKKSDTPCQRRSARMRFRRRAAIEPVIGHVKHDHRMARNFLKGVLGDAINLFMVAASFNFRKWMRKVAQVFAFILSCLLDNIIIERYADDFVMGFQHRNEAIRFLAEFKARLNQFGLILHPKKTRLIEFGRFAAGNREGKPETFDFLGFTHICATTRIRGWFLVRRKTVKKRLRAALRRIKTALRGRVHAPISEVGNWLKRVVLGYYRYHTVPGNCETMRTVREDLIRNWFKGLRRRGQKRRINWQAFSPIVRFWIPTLKVMHPHPNERFYANHPR